MAQKDIGTLRTRLSWEDDGANKSLEGFRRDLKGLRSEMALAKSGGKDYTNSLKGIQQQSDILSRRFKTQEARVKELKKRYDESVKVKGEDANATRDLQAQLNNATAEMNRTEGQLQRLNNEIKRMESPWTKLGEGMTKTGETLQTVGRGMTDFGKDYSMKVTAPIVAGGVAMFKASMDYESAFAGVRKTVNLSEEGYASLSEGIRDMAKELPASATGIAGVAEAAGQLGIENDSILSFTRTIIDLGESTNLSLEQASSEFARFANIVGMSQEDFDRLGSSVVGLGNTMATTESEIMSMSMRLAAQGSQVGMSEAQITALAATMSSLGIESEAGGTAMSTVLKKIDKAVGESGEELAGFAKAAGTSSGEFAKAWNNDPIKALDLFVKGLASSSDEGANLTTILDDLGIKGIRESDTILRMAGASDLLSEAVNTSTKAWKDNTALTDEAAQRYATTESQLKILWNRTKDMAITLGDALVPAAMDALEVAEPLIQKIEDGAQAFADMTEEEQQTIIKTAALVAAIGPASIGLGQMATGIGGVLKVGGGLSSMLGKAGGKGLIGGIGLLAPLATSPVGLAIGGTALLAGGIYALTKESRELKKVSFETADALLAQNESNEKMIDDFDKIRIKSGLTNDEFGRYIDLQNELKSTSNPQVIADIEKEMGELEGKSRLTNDELIEMISLNGDLVEALPGATGVISDQGTKVAGTTTELEKYNAEIAKMATLEMEDQFYKALENQNILLEDQVTKQKELERSKGNIALIEETISLYNQGSAESAREMLETRSKELRDAINHRTVTGEKLDIAQEELLVVDDLRRALGEGGQALNEQLISHSQIKTEQDKELINIEQQIAQFDQVTSKLMEHYLMNAGISEEKARQAVQNGDAISAINDQISALEAQKEKIKEQTPLNLRNTDEYKNAVAEIDNQIIGLQGAQGNVERLIGLAGDYNEELGKNIDKEINAKPKPAIEYLNERFGAAVSKQVNVNPSPSIETLNTNLSSPITRLMKIKTEGVSGALRGYAAATINHPGGLALVGDEQCL